MGLLERSRVCRDFNIPSSCGIFCSLLFSRVSMASLDRLLKIFGGKKVSRLSFNFNSTNFINKEIESGTEVN